MGDHITKNRAGSFFIILIAFGIFFFGLDRVKVGSEIDSFQNIPVFHNGMMPYQVQGKNYSDDGYYYGLKWQCVEFVQRYYYDKLAYKMIDPRKDARDFFDESVSQGMTNKVTGLKQYKNGGNMKPQVGDILVFHGGKYGHVALVTKVDGKVIEIIQQNVYGKPREELLIISKEGLYQVKSEKELMGWLRYVP